MSIDQNQSAAKASKDEAARTLAQKHFEIEEGLTHIFRLNGPGDVEASDTEPIKLLEVNEATASAGVMPLHFGPLPGRGIPYPSVIIEVTPSEYEQILAEEVKLPKGWTIGEELAKTEM